MGPEGSEPSPENGALTTHQLFLHSAVCINPPTAASPCAQAPGGPAVSKTDTVPTLM